jgi:polyisoprenoid-binding protein YceI
VREVAVTVPVATLHSEKEGLDKNMRKAMSADRYPDVTFHLDQHDIAPGAADTVAIHAGGALKICAQERPIELPARAYPGEGGVWLEGSYPLLMSDYGIKPPTMMMGTIRVGDRVNVRYRLLLVP